jgi:3-dehydroquinate dehydratase II
MLKFLVIHGPNLDQLGQREESLYGTISLESINLLISKHAESLSIEVEIMQSNDEGVIIAAILAARTKCDGIIINPAGFGYSSIGIRDAITAVRLPVVEVHLSNIHAREPFRRNTLIAPIAIGQISGFKATSYLLAVTALADFIKHDCM